MFSSEQKSFSQQRLSASFELDNSSKVEDENRVLDIRALNSDYNKSYQGTTNGSGVPNQSMAGVPHFKDSEFIGEYPIATINFMDDTFPGKVSMTAFNPLIPQNSKDSSIPCACFIFKVLNDTDKPLTYQVTGMLGNPAFQSSKHEVSVKENLTTITMFPGGKSKNKTIEAGNMSLSAIGDNLSYQQFYLLLKKSRQLVNFLNQHFQLF